MKARVPKDLLQYEVENLYSTYCAFINRELPKFKFGYVTDGDTNNFAQVIYPKRNSEKFKLLVSKSILSQDIRSRKNILFHEFTHIWDAVRILPDDFSKEKYELIETYSEINASKIEIMSAANFETINDPKFMSIEDVIHIDNKDISLMEWVNYSSARLINSQLQFTGSKSNEDFAHLYKDVLYNIGYMNATNRYSDKEIDIYEVMSFLDIKLVNYAAYIYI